MVAVPGGAGCDEPDVVKVVMWLQYLEELCVTNQMW